jgi:hypothetical protein
MSSEVDTIIDEAADWFVRMDEEATEPERLLFAGWLEQSLQHVREYLRIAAIAQELKNQARSAEQTRFKAQQDMSRALYARYCRPVHLMFEIRGFEAGAARSLTDCVIRQALARLDVASMNRESTRFFLFEAVRCLVNSTLKSVEMPIRPLHVEEVPADFGLEVRGKTEEMMQAISILLRQCVTRQEADTLRRLYAYGESHSSICHALRISEREFRRSLWSIRERFDRVSADKLLPEQPPASSPCIEETLKAADYVADLLDAASKEAFERQMLESECCTQEVDVWFAIKRQLRTEEEGYALHA